MKSSLSFAIFTILSIFLFTNPLTAFSGGLDADLAEILNSNSNKPISTIVFLKDNFKAADYRGNRAALRLNMRSYRESSQKDLMNYLNSQPEGQVLKAEGLWAIDAVILEAAPEVIRNVADRNDVNRVALDVEFRLPDSPEAPAEITPDASSIWSISLVRADKVWKDLNIDGKNVVVGHIDTGVDEEHPDLKGKVIAFRDFTKDGVEVKAYDDQGHGTHTAGTIVGGNASGNYIGVAPEAKLVSAKVFTKSGSTQSSWILEAMQWMLDPDDDPMTDDAPRLVSNSWGSNSTTNDYYWDIVHSWLAAEIVPVFSAGNNGYSGMGTCGTPANFPHSFAIGATDRDDRIASFSSRGPTTWHGVERIKPDVSAPGASITSAKNGGGWTSKNGTSMSCPNVAGTIALMLQADNSLKVQDIISILESTSVELGEPGKDNFFGYGRTDSFDAVDFVLNGGTLAGTVKSGFSPVKGATISIADSTRKTVSDENGQFSFMLKEGTYTINVEAMGYRPYEQSVRVTKKNTTNVNISLQEAVKVKVSGRISDEAGNPLDALLYVLNTDLEPVTPDNNGRYSLTLPSGVWNLEVRAFGYETSSATVKLTTFSETKNFELLKLPPVLLVIDDKNKGYESYYQAALNEADINFAETTSPAEGTLLQYPVVIWFTGDDSSSTLTSDDQAMLSKYLDAGGALLLSGQDIGYNIKSSTFYSKRLGATYIKDTSASHDVSGIAEPFADVNATLKGGDGAGNQKYPDVIKATANGSLIINYGDGTGAATAVVTDTSKVIYLGFGIEGIASSSNRTAILKKSVEWLAGDERDNLQRAASAIKLETIKMRNSSARISNRLDLHQVHLERLISKLDDAVNNNNVRTVVSIAVAIENLGDDDLNDLEPLMRGIFEWSTHQKNSCTGSMNHAVNRLITASAERL